MTYCEKAAYIKLEKAAVNFVECWISTEKKVRMNYSVNFTRIAFYRQIPTLVK